MTRKISGRWMGLPVLAVAVILVVAQSATACPFCNAQQLTFSEEIGGAKVALFATLILPEKKAALPANGEVEIVKRKFEIIEVLKGREHLKGKKFVETTLFSPTKRINPTGRGPIFLLMGIDPPNIKWSTPITLTERSMSYIKEVVNLPKKSAERLPFFLDYFENKEELLARDAYDEFAKASYQEVSNIKKHLPRKKLIKWLQSSDIPTTRRRLYFTLLSVCGTADDLPMLEELIKSNDRRKKAGLDALVNCYLSLKGASGLDLIDNQFLSNKDAAYTDTYSAIMAIRFQGEEGKSIGRKRLLASLRLMLERDDLADLVIPDLARWEDWSAMPRLVELFKKSDEDSSWVRVPVIMYLRACDKPEAKKHLEAIAKIDPESLRRADSFFPYGATSRPQQKTAKKPEKKPTSKSSDKKKITSK